MIGSHARIMSLRDGTKKMSKSDPAAASRILLTDTADQIWAKVKKAKTDSVESIHADPVQRPEVTNLLSILSALTDRSVPDWERELRGRHALQLKRAVADAIIETVVPIGEEHKRVLMSGVVDEVLKEGAEAANELANETLDAVRHAIGIS